MAPAILAGVAGGLLVAVGTHEPAVEVLLLRPGAGATGLPTLAAVGRLHLLPPQRPPLRCTTGWRFCQSVLAEIPPYEEHGAG
jgi:hypothetical protein